MRRLTSLTTGVVCAAAMAVAGLGTVASAAPPDRSGAGPATEAGERKASRTLEELALPLGLQVARKHAKRPKRVVGGTSVSSANPYVSLVPDVGEVDFAYWAAHAQRQGEKRVQPRAAVPFVHDEQEPARQLGVNDTQRNAEPVVGFGHGADEGPAVRIGGRLAPPPGMRTRRIQTREDQGSIRRATPTRIPARSDKVVVSSRIGDGPHGQAGSGSGDFDFFEVRARAGQTISAKMVGRTNFDTVVVLYDAEGTPIAANDDTTESLLSDLTFTVAETGTYYIMVTGFLALPEDPFSSGSGTGAADEGRYRMEVFAGPRDVDYYAVQLEAGDVLGGALEGAATRLQVYTPSGQPRVGSEQDVSFIYPMASPLPGGGNVSFAYVAERAGLYAVEVSQGRGRYNATLEVYRPGVRSSGEPVTQRIFLDFDGERVNTGVFGGSGVSELSPLSRFLRRWGIARRDLDPVIDEVVATVTENVNADLEARGLNDDFEVEILNSRDHADPFGEPNVSRVIIGGTIRESGVYTIGVAQSIDPGNFEHEETALLLLDVLSHRNRRNEASLNAYLRARSDRVGFVGTALGNVASHEIGHYIGSFHVDPFNKRANLMDAGGNFHLMFGVGPDGVGGTADDPDVDFGVDRFWDLEGFLGLEHTLNRSAWASFGP